MADKVTRKRWNKSLARVILDFVDWLINPSKRKTRKIRVIVPVRLDPVLKYKIKAVSHIRHIPISFLVESCLEESISNLKPLIEYTQDYKFEYLHSETLRLTMKKELKDKVNEILRTKYNYTMGELIRNIILKIVDEEEERVGNILPPTEVVSRAIRRG